MQSSDPCKEQLQAPLSWIASLQKKAWESDGHEVEHESAVCPFCTLDNVLSASWAKYLRKVKRSDPSPLFSIGESAPVVLCSVLVPQYKRDIDMLKSVQRSTTMMEHLSYEERIRQLWLFVLEKTQGESMSLNTWRESADDRTMLNSVCPEPGQWRQKSLMNTHRGLPARSGASSTSVLCRWWRTDTGFPEAVGSSPWRSLEATWTWAWAPCCGSHCCSGAGTRGPRDSFQPQKFCDIFRKLWRSMCWFYLHIMLVCITTLNV